MDFLLLAVTIVSLAAALGCGALAWSLLRTERRRSEARAIALSAAIDAGDPSAAIPAEPVPVSGLFAPERSAAANGNPMIKAAVAAAMCVLLIAALASSNRGGEKSADEAETIVPPAAAPLELVSMRHTRDGDKLTVTGLVRNPRAGREVTRVTAVVTAFDRTGSFTASGRAPLDFTSLPPGDESPFVVSVPGGAAVSRYRVSFRTDAGVLRHVDRRLPPGSMTTAAHLPR